tara:strand:+ start:2284 stop:2526 length:243 start_codon:yes stop_codon:yes gene_type:complete
MADDNWDKLNKLTKATNRSSLEKKVGKISKVISDPDMYNVNIASREKFEELEKRMVELEELVVKLNKRIDGLSYLVKKSI